MCCEMCSTMSCCTLLLWFQHFKCTQCFMWLHKIDVWCLVIGWDKCLKPTCLFIVLYLVVYCFQVAVICLSMWVNWKINFFEKSGMSFFFKWSKVSQDKTGSRNEPNFEWIKINQQCKKLFKLIPFSCTWMQAFLNFVILQAARKNILYR